MKKQLYHFLTFNFNESKRGRAHENSDCKTTLIGKNP